MIYRAFVFPLHPTAEQAAKLEQWIGVTRLVYNLALEQRRTWRGRTFAAQEREVTELRAAFDFIADVPRYALTGALRDLERAFTAFVRRISRYPQFRRKGENDSFRLQGQNVWVRHINKRWGAVKLPKIGRVRFRMSREIAGKVQNVTIAKQGDVWTVSFACAIEHEAPANGGPSVGIDRGIANTVMLSTGETFALPASLAKLDRSKRKAQRILSRRKRGSKRRLKALRRVNRLAARIARIRGDWQHRASLSIARRFGHVALENLKIANMTKRAPGKRGLNRSILEQGWGAFAEKLAYKLEERGGALVMVNPAYTSQACSACGTVDRRSRESQSSFVCVECGFALNADHNAAINILRRSTPAMPVEGCGCAPVEAGTCLEAA